MNAQDSVPAFQSAFVSPGMGDKQKTGSGDSKWSIAAVMGLSLLEPIQKSEGAIWMAA